MLPQQLETTRATPKVNICCKQARSQNSVKLLARKRHAQANTASLEQLNRAAEGFATHSDPNLALTLPGLPRTADPKAASTTRQGRTRNPTLKSHRYIGHNHPGTSSSGTLTCVHLPCQYTRACSLTSAAVVPRGAAGRACASADGCTCALCTPQ
jgi:hypothetical protein